MPNAISVAAPTLEPANSSATVRADPVPALPMVKTTPPDTGWLSAEITRYVAV